MYIMQSRTKLGAVVEQIRLRNEGATDKKKSSKTVPTPSPPGVTKVKEVRLKS